MCVTYVFVYSIHSTISSFQIILAWRISTSCRGVINRTGHSYPLLLLARNSLLIWILYIYLVRIRIRNIVYRVFSRVCLISVMLTPAKIALLGKMCCTRPLLMKYTKWTMTGKVSRSLFSKGENLTNQGKKRTLKKSQNSVYLLKKE